MNNYLTDVHYDKHRILYEACITGQAECARLLKFAIPLEEGEDYLLDVLMELRDGPLQSSVDYQAFELLTGQCISVLSTRETAQASLYQTQDQAGGVLKTLQHRDWGQWKDAVKPSSIKTGPRCTSVYGRQIERLFLYWRQSQDSEGEFESLCRTTAELAVEMNRIDLAEALYDHIEQDIASMGTQSVIQAGEVDGGIRLLEAYDLKCPGTWHRTTIHRHQITTIGQATLRNSLSMLQADSVRFLLERQVRLPDSMLPIDVSWRYRRTRDRQYEAIKQLLEEYKMRLLSVLLEG